MILGSSYSDYTTITGWGVLLKYQAFQYHVSCLGRLLRCYHFPELTSGLGIGGCGFSCKLLRCVVVLLVNFSRGAEERKKLQDATYLFPNHHATPTRTLHGPTLTSVIGLSGSAHTWLAT